MRVLIALTVSEGFHQSCRRIAEMKRNRIGGSLLDIFCHRSKCRTYGIRLRSQGEVSHCLRERELAFGCAEKIVSVASCERNAKSLWRCQPDILHRHAHDTPRDIERIFSRGEHASEPVQ